MKLFKDQILGGTTVDSQGEKVPKKIFEGFVETYKGKSQPLNQAHDLGHKSAGYIENLRLIEHPVEEGEWALVGDVYCDTENLQTALGGFSISYLEITHRSDQQEQILSYLPFPYYNDSEFIGSLLNEGNVSVGKWVKKDADPAVIAMIGATAVFILKPVWEDFYKTQLAPIIYKFFSDQYQSFKSKNISADLIQAIELNGSEIQVVLIPDRGNEQECFSIEQLDKAMNEVHTFLYSSDGPNNIVRIYMYFHSIEKGFLLHRTEDANGEIEHYA